MRYDEQRLSFDPVVGRFLRNLHVECTRLAHACSSDLDEFCAAAQLVDGGTTAISHRRPNAAHELMDHGDQRPFVGDASFDALRYQLLVLALAFGVLEVAV